MTIYKLQNPPANFYASRAIRWCWCSKPDKDKNIRSTGTWSNCRETVANDIKRDVKSHKKHFNLDMRTARILCGFSIAKTATEETYNKTKKSFMAKMQRAVNFINILEERHGWGLTKLHEVDPSNDKLEGKKHPWSKTLLVPAPNILCMFTGSQKWLRSPHMVSLWLLILRTAGHKYLWNPKTYEALEKKVANYLEKTKSSDASYVRASYPYWDAIMGNYTKLFKGFPVSRNFTPKAWCGNDINNEGIYKLCKGTTADRDLLTRFNEVCK